MENKEFSFEKTVYLGNTNMFGNVYFARYFDWQGEAREAFFQKTVPNSLEIFKSGIKFVTIEAAIKYHRETRVFDEVVIKVRAENFKITTLDLVFTYVNKKTGELVAVGKQKLGFVDPQNKVIPIPEQLKKSWEKFLE
jgi:enediyne core biosynthesis thioesterase